MDSNMDTVALHEISKGVRLQRRNLLLSVVTSNDFDTLKKQ